MTETQISHLDLAADMVRQTPQAAALGIRLVSAEPGFGVMAVAYRADLVGDPATGVLAGGVITSLLDHVCGYAASSSQFAGPHPMTRHSVATLDLRIDYLRPAEPGREVLARAHCYHRTRSIAFVRAAAYEQDEANPIATAQGAFAITVHPTPEAPT